MLTAGQVLRFRPMYLVAKYGATATVTAVTVSIGLPYGNRTTWVSLVTANGTELQWSLRQVKRDLAG